MWNRRKGDPNDLDLPTMRTAMATKLTYLVTPSAFGTCGKRNGRK